MIVGRFHCLRTPMACPPCPAHHQDALWNPFALMQECLGPRLCGHLKHLICCAAFLAIITFGAPIFNAVLPVFRCAASGVATGAKCRVTGGALNATVVLLAVPRSWLNALPEPANWVAIGIVIVLLICCCCCCYWFVRIKRAQMMEDSESESDDDDEDDDAEDDGLGAGPSTALKAKTG